MLDFMQPIANVTSRGKRLSLFETNGMQRILLLFLFLVVISLQAQSSKEIVYAGTFSARGSEGIYVYDFERSGSTLQLIQTVNTPESPTFLALHPSGKFLYSVNRGAVAGEKNSGSVSAYSIDQGTGKLTLLNHKSSYGNGPCHISTDQTGKLVFISNYVEGNLVVFPLSPDGSLGECTDSIRFTGKGIHKERQDKPHIHSATPSPDNRFLFVADLGTDRIYSFEINLNAGRLTPAQTPYTEVKPGSGPRHFTFHPDGQHAYLAEELTSSVASFSYQKKTGKLELMEDQVMGLPAGFNGTNTSADIHTDASGKFLMMSNRGHESISLYSIAKNGKIKLLKTVNTEGQKPRNFLVDKKNEFVLVAHQDTDNITLFKWQAKERELTAAGVPVKIPSPVCLKMITIDK
jgi:6-phosphogluconolactonase